MIDHTGISVSDFTVSKQFHPNYYGAFVLDPDGHNIEAVCHDPA
jgi:catechol 2,3-dioxygenase-like lactoylglutathione lyase family enzyme